MLHDASSARHAGVSDRVARSVAPGIWRSRRRNQIWRFLVHHRDTIGRHIAKYGSHEPLLTLLAIRISRHRAAGPLRRCRREFRLACAARRATFHGRGGDRLRARSVQRLAARSQSFRRIAIDKVIVIAAPSAPRPGSPAVPLQGFEPRPAFGRYGSWPRIAECAAHRPRQRAGAACNSRAGRSPLSRSTWKVTSRR